MPPVRHLLDQLFGSRTRAKILRLLLTNPDNAYFVREMSRKIGEHVNSVRRELQFLSQAGFVRASGEGQKRFYQANNESPVFPELKALVFKAQVMEERVLLGSIQRSGRVYLMVLTGFFVGREELPTDLLVVGSINRGRLQRLLATFRHHFDREIRFTVMSRQEYDYRHNLTDRFLYSVLAGPLITVVDKRKSPND